MEFLRMALKWFEETPAAKAAKKLVRYQVSRTLVHDPRLPYCDAPVPLAMEQRASARLQSLRVEMFRPCRKCEKCLSYRRLKWRDRMIAENTAAYRSWFVTLTFSPTHLAGIHAEAHQLGDASATGIEVAAYKHVQGYLKRLRKTGARFRYVAVPEYGEERGRLHYHLLVHETSFGSVTYRGLQSKWRSFISASLVKSARGSGAYVSKYLTKNSTIIRASLNYGSPPFHPK